MATGDGREEMLTTDFHRVQKLGASHPEIEVIPGPGSPPEEYQLVLHVPGVMREGGEVKPISLHRVRVVLGPDYPARAPDLFWETPVFHPNIAPPRVCLQGRLYAAGVTLDEIFLTMAQMVDYRLYNVKSVLNKEAGAWALENAHRLPLKGPRGER